VFARVDARLRVPQIRLPSSRRPFRPGGHVSSHSVRRPPVASSRLPAPHGLLHCASPPRHHLGFPDCPGEDSNLPVPPGGPGRAAHEKGRPAGPPPTRAPGMCAVVTSM
jgi:hypothetical protein